MSSEIQRANALYILKKIAYIYFKTLDTSFDAIDWLDCVLYLKPLDMERLKIAKVTNQELQIKDN